MLPICCTNRHQCPSQALPVQLVLQHWAGGTTPALGATILTALRKAKTKQWERYGTLGTKNGKLLQDHRKRSHCTDVFQFKRSREQESKAGERQTSPEKAHLSADHTSPSNFSISRIHFSKACNFSPFCQQLQLQKSFGLGKAHSY